MAFDIGILCSIIQIGIGYPFELLKTRSQMLKHYNLKNDILILKKKNLLSFYQGCGPSFFISIITNHIQFQSYLICKHEYKDNGLIGGIIGGFLSGIFLNPFEIIKCHCQNNQKIHFVPYWYLSGIKYTLLRELIGNTTYFMTYEYCHEKIIDNSFTSGGIAGVMSLLCSYRIDQKKTQMQLNYKQNHKFISWIGLKLMICRSFLVNSVIFYTIHKLNY